MKESEYLSETLSRYGLEGANAEFIRHNENLTYNIGGEYLLRIHKPKDGFSAESVFCGYDRTALRRTELELLKHLHDKGMTVQLPVQNADGDLVTVLSDGTAATMLKWIEGRMFDATFVLNILLGIVLHIELWTKEEWFDRKCDTWKREIFDPFLKGDEVIGLA